MKQVPVIIVGAGPAGLAVAASLSVLSVSSLILERDDCIAPLWRKRAYDSLHLHLAKKYCELPHFPYPPTYPTFISRADFLNYLERYAEMFGVNTLLSQEVKSAHFDEKIGMWRISAMNVELREMEEYEAKYLVVASGENDVAFVPEIDGIDTFQGKVVHSSKYKSDLDYTGKDVLVVGSGNSGMEIAHDLCSFGARTSIVVRSPFHIVSRQIWLIGMMFSFLPLRMVDAIVLFLCNLKFGETSKYGINRPTKGPFYLKMNTSAYPVVDIGTFQKIKTGEIQVLPSLKSIKGNSVTFSDGKSHHFDVIILSTGYRSMIKNWLKSDDNLIDDDGMCKKKDPNHWKGENGLYCTGLARRGIYGIKEDALNIAYDINDEFKM